MKDKFREILEEYRKAGNPHDNITTNYHTREKELLNHALCKIEELQLTKEELMGLWGYTLPTFRSRVLDAGLGNAFISLIISVQEKKRRK